MHQFLLFHHLHRLLQGEVRRVPGTLQAHLQGPQERGRKAGH